MINEIICGIYCIENLVNGKKYIGQSIDIHKRWKDHVDALNANKHYNAHLQRSWNLYKRESFKFYIVEQCDADDLNRQEMFYVDKLDTYHNGYNQTRGGDGSHDYKHSDDAKAKMSSIKLEQFKDIKNREKLRDAHEFESRAIYQIDFDGNIVNEWPSVNWAAKTLEINSIAICNALKRRQRKKTYSGYIWVYVDDYDSNTFDVEWYTTRQWGYKTYYQYDLNYNLINEWNSVVDAEAVGFKRGGIYRCVSGKTRTYKGFIFTDRLIDTCKTG